MPYECKGGSGIDNTLEIGTFDGQPPMIILAGTTDTVTPYIYSKEAVEKAQSEGIPAELITMTGPGHVNWEDVHTNYFEDLTTNLYDLVTKDANMMPDGCQASQ